MSMSSFSTFYDLLKTSRVCSSKIAVIAAIVVGIEEYYFSGIYKMLQKIMEKINYEYECTPKGMLDFSWSFDDSGLYAANIHKSDWFLSIIIYDCIEKKAYNYCNQFSIMKPDYFWWFNGDLILLYIDQNNYIQQFQIELDHENRRTMFRITRTHDFPCIITEDGDCLKPFMKKIRTKPLVETIETAVIEGKEYIVLISVAGAAVIMIPKDPSSGHQMRQSIYYHPVNDQLRVDGVEFQILPQMCHQQFLFFPKLNEGLWTNKAVQKYMLDEFIVINLEEQKDVNGKAINWEQIWTERNHSGRNVLFNHVGSVPDDIMQLWSVLSAKRFGNGKVLAVVEDDDSKRRYSSFIDVTTKQITWRKWLPKIQRNSNMILSSLHPSGYLIEIDYKNKQEDNKYKLFSKIVAHPNEPIKLKTMSLVNLFNTETPIQASFKNYIRRFL